MTLETKLEKAKLKKMSVCVTAETVEFEVTVKIQLRTEVERAIQI